VIITYHDLQITEPLRKEGRSIHEYRKIAIDRAFKVIQGGEFGLGTEPRSDGVSKNTGQEMSNTIDSGG